MLMKASQLVSSNSESIFINVRSLFLAGMYSLGLQTFCSRSFSILPDSMRGSSQVTHWTEPWGVQGFQLGLGICELELLDGRMGFHNTRGKAIRGWRTTLSLKPHFLVLVLTPLLSGNLTVWDESRLLGFSHVWVERITELGIPLQQDCYRDRASLSTKGFTDFSYTQYYLSLKNNVHSTQLLKSRSITFLTIILKLELWLKKLVHIQALSPSSPFDDWVQGCRCTTPTKWMR